MLNFQKNAIVDIPVINGAWSEWEDFSPCTVSCGGGNQTRSRACDNPEPHNGGSDCETETEHGLETVPCNLQSCDGKLILKQISEM